MKNKFRGRRIWLKAGMLVLLPLPALGADCKPEPCQAFAKVELTPDGKAKVLKLAFEEALPYLTKDLKGRSLGDIAYATPNACTAETVHDMKVSEAWQQCPGYPELLIGPSAVLDGTAAKPRPSRLRLSGNTFEGAPQFGQPIVHCEKDYCDIQLPVDQFKLKADELNILAKTPDPHTNGQPLFVAHDLTFGTTAAQAAPGAPAAPPAVVLHFRAQFDPSGTLKSIAKIDSAPLGLDVARGSLAFGLDMTGPRFQALKRNIFVKIYNKYKATPFPPLTTDAEKSAFIEKYDPKFFARPDVRAAFEEATVAELGKSYFNSEESAGKFLIVKNAANAILQMPPVVGLITKTIVEKEGARITTIANRAIQRTVASGQRSVIPLPEPSLQSFVDLDKMRAAAEVLAKKLPAGLQGLRDSDVSSFIAMFDHADAPYALAVLRGVSQKFAALPRNPDPALDQKRAKWVGELAAAVGQVQGRYVAKTTDINLSTTARAAGNLHQNLALSVSSGHFCEQSSPRRPVDTQTPAQYDASVELSLGAINQYLGEMQKSGKLDMCFNDDKADTCENAGALWFGHRITVAQAPTVGYDIPSKRFFLSIPDVRLFDRPGVGGAIARSVATQRGDVKVWLNPDACQQSKLCFNPGDVQTNLRLNDSNPLSFLVGLATAPLFFPFYDLFAASIIEDEAQDATRKGVAIPDFNVLQFSGDGQSIKAYVNVK